jgi:hypothetical protein
MTELKIAGVVAVLFALSTPANAQSRIGSANTVKPEASGTIGGTLWPEAAFMPMRRSRLAPPARLV